MSAVILIVEDDHSIASTLSRALVRAGFAAVIAANLQTARDEYAKHRPSLVVLDLMLPDGNGLDLLTDLRAVNDRVPIIITSGQIGLEHQLTGFDAGVNDYVTKPYTPAVVVAKVAAWLDATTAMLGCTLVFDPETRTLTNGDRSVVRTPTEAWLLFALAGHPNSPQKRHLLVDQWPGADRPKNRTLDRNVFLLRGKLKAVGADHCIHTDRHAYTWNGEVRVSRSVSWFPV